METLLGQCGAYVDALYYCPHHPESGFAGERKEYKIVCQCRKPEIGLVKKAANDLNLDLANSWFIGDATVDVETAKRAGMRSVLLRTGLAGKDGKFTSAPDFACKDLQEAVSLIINH
jgi:histidinol-phosphate phosphatase family protein